MREPDMSRAIWRKSRRSGNGASCVEVADLPGHVAVRDSKNPDGPWLTFGREAWRTFNRDIQSGTYNR
jgi:hypothetical protein